MNEKSIYLCNGGKSLKRNVKLIKFPETNQFFKMELKENLEKINRLSEELEKLRPLSSENEQKVMQKFRLDWNYNSNNLEGNSLTYGETKALLLFGITAQGKPLKDHIEIEGHNEAIDYIIKVARAQESLTEAMIRHLHKMILHEPYEIDALTADGQPTRKRVEIGKYKTTPNQRKHQRRWRN